METKTIWLDGKLVSSAEATCAISCASLAGGMVALEDAPLFTNERGSFVFRVDDHVKQYERSAKIAHIELPYTSSKLAKAALKVAKASVANGHDEGVVRFVADFTGVASADRLLPLGDEPSVAVFCMPFSSEGDLASAESDAYSGCGDSLSDDDGLCRVADRPSSLDEVSSGEEGALSSKGDSSRGVPCDACDGASGKANDPNFAVDSEMVTAGISSWRAISNNALPPQAELAASRANAVFALREARLRGFDEPILLNEAGDVCSGARKAVFAVRDGVLSTPPLACGVRESVERDTVINFAMDLDIPVVEECMTRADLCIADELFLCDVMRGVVAVSSIDGCAIGKPGKTGPKPGPITKAIQERYAKMLAGKLDEYAAWIAQVE